MGQMTVLELLQCFAWGMFGVAPLLSMVLVRSATNDAETNAGFFFVLLAVAIQVAFGIACFKVGGQ